MISFITAFKNFIGPDRMAQRSAMWSWQYSDIPVFAPDNEPFVRANCSEFPNVLLMDGVVTGHGYGFENACPIIRDLIKWGLRFSDTPLIALINGDILITRDFRERLGLIVDKYGQDMFMSGTRQEIDLQYEVNSEETYNRFHEESLAMYNEINSADIFIGPRQMFEKMATEMPELLLGRYGWDNWIHFWAVVNAPQTLNCTHALPTIHCQHDHSHIEHQEGKPGRKALSSVHNLTHLRNMQNLYGDTVRINKWPVVEI